MIATRNAAAAVLVAVVAVAVAVLVTVDDGPSRATVRGSGRPATESRSTAPFTRVDLAGANTVVVHAGARRSVRVRADDNLVGRVTTSVHDGTLVVANRGSFTTRRPMTVDVSLPALEGVTISGAGTLEASGKTDRLSAVLTGAGTLDLGALVARDVVARLAGTGTIRLHATSTLDATLTGTGSIVYAGHPRLRTHKTGTGTIAAE